MGKYKYYSYLPTQAGLVPFHCLPSQYTAGSPAMLQPESHSTCHYIIVSLDHCIFVHIRASLNHCTFVVIVSLQHFICVSFHSCFIIYNNNCNIVLSQISTCSILLCISPPQSQSHAPDFHLLQAEPWHRRPPCLQNNLQNFCQAIKQIFLTCVSTDRGGVQAPDSVVTGDLLGT